MFEILSLNQRMLSIIGLRLQPNKKISSVTEKFVMFTMAGSMLTLVISSVIYALEHSAVLMEFVEGFYIVCIFGMFLTVYINFVLGKATIPDLLDAMQRIVEMSREYRMNLIAIMF